MQDDNSWYVARGSEQIGPITHLELLAFAEQGELRADDQVWHPGLADWQRVSDVPGLLQPPKVATAHASPPPPPQPSTPETQAPPRQSSPENNHIAGASRDDPKLVGVGGWLLFFCLSLTVFAPMLILAELGRSFEEMRRYSASIAGFESFHQALIVMSLMLALASVWVGVTVWRQRLGAHILASHFLLTTFGLACVAPFAIFLFVNVPSDNVGAVIAGAVPDILKSAFSTLIWYLYLKRSKRVVATFGPA